MQSTALIALALIATLATAKPQYDPNHGEHNYIGRHGSATASSAPPVIVAPSTTSTTAGTATTTTSATPTSTPGQNATKPASSAESGPGSAAAAQATAKPQDKSAGSKGVQVGSTFALLAVSGAMVFVL